jgi:hypothetical protein
MTAPPLTHHDILALVAPFTRSGRQVDLGATDRLQRRVVFKSVERAGDGPQLAGLRETLQLEVLRPRRYRLTRTLQDPSGAQVRLEALGPVPAQLLTQVDAVPARAQFHPGPGFLILRFYTLEVEAQPAESGQFQAAPALTHAELRLPGLNLGMKVSATRNVSAEILLCPAPGSRLDLPEDLLAVLGWNWSPLIRSADGWHSQLRLRCACEQRRPRVEQALDLAAAHLAQTLAEPPERFHERHLKARWQVALRRAVPILTPLVLLLAVLAMPRLDFGQHPGMWLLFGQIPMVLIALSFMLQDQARLEIPPWPRRSPADSWQAPEPPDAGAQAQA